MDPILVAMAAFPVVAAPSGGIFRPLSRHLGRRTPEQIFQLPHVVDPIHQADLYGGPRLALGSYSKATTAEHVLVAKHLFHPSASPGAGAVGCLLLFVQLPALVYRIPELRFPLLRAVGRIGPDGTPTVLFVEQFIEYPAVEDCRVGYRMASDPLVFLVDVEVVLVTVMALAVFLGPAGIKILLALLVQLCFPFFGHLALLDVRVLLAPVTVPRHVHQAGIDDLPTFGQKSGQPQLLIEGIKQLFHHSMTGQLFPEQPEGLGVGYAIFRRKPQKPLERQAIGHLKLSLVVRQVVQRLQHPHLEHPHWIPRLAAHIAFTGLLVDFLQQRLEGVPVHDLVQSRQGIAQPFQLDKTVFRVKETGLHDVLRTVSVGCADSTGSANF